MNILKENSSHKFNDIKYKSKRFADKNDGYVIKEFKNSIFSFKNDDLCFTNYLKGKKDYKFYKTLDLIKYLFKNKTLDPNLFAAEDLQNNNFKKLKRVQNILNNSENIDLSYFQISEVRKYKYLNDTGLQLYFYKEGNDLKLITIDTFHLIIPDKEHDHKKDYELYKENTYNIKKIYKKVKFTAHR